MTNTVGSRAVTPNRNVATTRVSPYADAMPMATPSSATPIPWRITMFRTACVVAPSARRMPISCVCCCTE